jgi:uncharacterized protein (TIGR02246 family)
MTHERDTPHLSDGMVKEITTMNTCSTGTANDDDAIIRGIPQRMIDAWNHGDAVGFAHACTSDTDFIAFEGTHLVGRDQIIAFHQPLFDGVLAGSRLRGGARFARRLDADWAIVHGHAEVLLPGQEQPSPGRASMQLFVLHHDSLQWRIEAVQNSRLVTLDRQLLLDELDELPTPAQEALAQLLAAIPKAG